MASGMKSNGLPPEIGVTKWRSKDSGAPTPMLPSLGSCKSTHPTTVKKDEHLGLHDKWNKGKQFEREQSWQSFSDTTSHGSIGLLGLCAIGAFLSLALLMSFVALNREQKLNQLQPIVDSVKR